MCTRSICAGIEARAKTNGWRRTYEMAFASSWEFAATYIGPSAVCATETGNISHLAFVLEVVSIDSRKALNNKYYQASHWEVIAVWMRLWYFDINCEPSKLQCYARHLDDSDREKYRIHGL